MIGNRLLDTEIIFGIDFQKKFSISYAWDKARNYYIQKDGKFLTYTRNCEQKATIGIFKSTLKILPRHNSAIPIKIIGKAIKEHIAYFIMNDDPQKGRGPNINIFNGIHDIKGKTSVNILVSNYTSKHMMFNKGEYIGCLEPATEDSVNSDLSSHDLQAIHSTNSVTTKRMMAEEVKPDTFHPPHHKLKPSIESKFRCTPERICFSIHKRWNINRNNSSHRNDNWHRYLWSCISEAIPNCYEELSMGEKRNWKSYSQWRSYTAVDQVGQCQL